MWRDYSAGFIKNNRASGLSIMAAAFIASLFLSFLCSIFYNLWVYEIEAIVLEEGDWQGRLTGEFDELDMLAIQNFANVGSFAVYEERSGEKESVVDLYFQDARTIFQDMPLLADQLGLEEGAVSYHVQLLSNYLIQDPSDGDPPLLLTFYLVILLLVSFSLVLIIHNSFAVSMNARVHQFGIFSSIGATPAQIRICLMQEAAALCGLPVLLGSLTGMALSFGAVHVMNAMAKDMAGRHAAVFRYHPMIAAATILFSVLTVMVSAWLPAWKLSRMTPLESIRNPGGKQPKRKTSAPIMSLLFGVEGELAGNGLKAQKSALRTSTISLTLSFLGFTMMLCFFSLTDLSTKYTYVERYQDTWDVMVTVKDTGIEEFQFGEEIRDLEGVRDCIVYQKAEAVRPVMDGELSEDLTAMGGPETAAGSAVSRQGAAWLVKAPIVILDDTAFQMYCDQTGIGFQNDGAIILNRFWDSLNSSFRHREYIPFVKEDQESVVLTSVSGEGKAAEIPVLGHTLEVPVLKEEYANYSLVHFVPLSCWKQISGQLKGGKTDTFIRILGKEDAALAELNSLEDDIAKLIGTSYEIESENRLEDKISNDNMIRGYKQIIGMSCFLLAMIGIANVFSYTLGFLRQRRREFAQYRSIGLTPAGLRRMFFLEAFVIAGRPILITLPLTTIVVVFMAKASYLDLMEVMLEIPVMLIVAFGLVIVGFVGVAYYIGGKMVLGCDLVEALRDETMV